MQRQTAFTSSYSDYIHIAYH